MRWAISILAYCALLACITIYTYNNGDEDNYDGEIDLRIEYYMSAIAKEMSLTTKGAILLPANSEDETAKSILYASATNGTSEIRAIAAAKRRCDQMLAGGTSIIVYASCRSILGDDY